MSQKFNPLVKTRHLPRQLTSFVGRANELAEITEMLADPGCRLLTLLGPGGVGKTRLAIQAANGSLAAFADGVYFVPLQSGRIINLLDAAIIDALEVPLRGQDGGPSQLLNYLRDKEMLLLLDSFEQLLPSPPSPPEGGISGEDSPEGGISGRDSPEEGISGEDSPEEGKRGRNSPEGGISPDEINRCLDLLADILETAPDVKFLVTSREILNLQEEWLYPLAGLPFPTVSQIAPLSASLKRAEQKQDEEEWGAVQLFIERARRVRRDFTLADEQADVIRICQLVEGMPLAIELSASWTKTMSCAVIAAEIQRNRDFLATTLRNVPERHRSMQAVFEHSWQRLSQEERDVFKRLSVFRGGFRREAAERVAGASLAILSALVDKSLLRWDPSERYQIHGLLRQYAAEQLVRSPDDVAHIYDLRTAYYADFLYKRSGEIVGSRQQEVIQEITAELENIRAAWGHALVQVDIPNIQKATYTFAHFCDFQGRFQESADTFAKAIVCLENSEVDEQQQVTLATLLVFQGYNYIRLGRLEHAQQLFKRGQAIYRVIETPPPLGFGTDPTIGLGLSALVLGDYTQAVELSQEARQQNEARDNKQDLQINFYVLADATFAQGQYETAWEYAQQAYSLTEETGNRWMMANILSLLGNIARALGDYEQAQQYYQAGYAIKQEFNDPEGMSAALNHLAKIAWLQQNYQEAEQRYGQSQAIYREISDRGGLATSLHGLGDTALMQGDYQTASDHLQQALQIAVDMNWVPLTLSILISAGELLCQIGQLERGVELLALVDHHPAGDQEAQARAQKCLAQGETALPADLFAAAQQRGVASDLESGVSKAQTALSTPLKTAVAAEKSTAMTALPPGASALVEPLTERELEVLHLIAAGLTNQQIAEKLIISIGTTKWYTAQIYGKLNVSSRTQAVARARELELLV